MLSMSAIDRQGQMELNIGKAFINTRRVNSAKFGYEATIAANDMKCASYPNLALFTLLVLMNAFPMFNSICPCLSIADIDSIYLFITFTLFPLVFCFVLFCFVLFCFVLFCFVLFCFVLFCFVLIIFCSNCLSFLYIFIFLIYYIV